MTNENVFQVWSLNAQFVFLHTTLHNVINIAWVKLKHSLGFGLLCTPYTEIYVHTKYMFEKETTFGKRILAKPIEVHTCKTKWIK
jgi:hypothetical protein